MSQGDRVHYFQQGVKTRKFITHYLLLYHLRNLGYLLSKNKDNIICLSRTPLP